MITVSLLLTILLAVIVFIILFQIINLLAAKLGIDPVWVKVAYLIALLLVIIWIFSLAGISQPILK